MTIRKRMIQLKTVPSVSASAIGAKVRRAPGGERQSFR
jgi:hypothetical protein